MKNLNISEKILKIVKKILPFIFFLNFDLGLSILYAGENNGTIGSQWAGDGNACALVCLSNNETYTNNGNIYGWRGVVNLRNRSGTTFTNSAGANVQFSGTGGWMPGGTNAETGTSTLNNTLNNYGTLGRSDAGNRPVHTESTGNNTVINYSTGIIQSNNIAVSLWSNRGEDVFTNSGTVTGGNYGFEASFKDRGQAGTLATLSLEFTNNSGGTITGTNQNGAHIAAPAVPTFINGGTITGGVDGVWFHSGTTVTTFTNTGTINGGTIDIDNDGTITTMNNDQGGDDVLTFDGKVPTNYNVTLNSTSDYGKIDFSNETGSLTFGINSSSTLAANTYSTVLKNIAAGNISNEATWTNYDSTYKWRLVANGDDWDLEVANRRTGYTTRITNTKLSEITTVLESLNTRGSRSTLTTNLDALSDTALEKAVRQIKGVTLQKSIGQSVKSNNNFRRAMSNATSTGNNTNLVRNNFADLTTADYLNFSGFSQNNFNMIDQNNFTFKDLATIYKNKNLLSFGSGGNQMFLRTFGGATDQDKVGNDIGYSSLTAGFVFGSQSFLNPDLQAGWGLGFSSKGLDYDEGYGLNNTHSLHANFFAEKNYGAYKTNLSFGTFLSQSNSTRNITEGATQTLKSTSYDLGFDIKMDLTKTFKVLGWEISPLASFSSSYVIQDDINESGGDLALDIKTDNLLQIKPEIGFSFDRNLSSESLASKKLSFSFFGSKEEKLDGSDSRATIRDTGDGYALIDNNKADKFLTSGLSYISTNEIKNSLLNFGAFFTQNEQGNMDSGLLTFNYQKKF